MGMKLGNRHIGVTLVIMKKIAYRFVVVMEQIVVGVMITLLAHVIDLIVMIVLPMIVMIIHVLEIPVVREMDNVLYYK